MHRYWRLGLALLLGKIAYLGIICLAVQLWPDLDGANADRVREVWFPTESTPRYSGLARHFATWDSEHYLYLSTAGYSPDARSIAFYPLWPLLIRGGAAVTGASGLVAGLVLANVLSLLGWLLFHHVTSSRLGERSANLALALLLAFPGSLFFQFGYSESLFFLLLMTLWWGMERNRYQVAWCAGFLAPLARGVGVFGVIPICWHWTVDQRRTRLARRAVSIAERSHEPHTEGTSGSGSTLLLAAPLIGWGTYLCLMWLWTGSPFAGLDAQRYWGAHAIGNLWDVSKFIAGFFRYSEWHAFSGSLLDRLAFLLLLNAIPSLWRVGKDLLVWVYALGVIPAMSGTFVSFVRFEACAFPVFIGWAVMLLGWRGRWPAAVFLIVNVLLHGVLLWQFVNFRWAG
ncbi:MAG: hypothetical protein H7A47_14985 [Verrucomicrobiales bacterium]|nr:hypothetical protein [Verrucomicrobiales bacterium]